MVKKPAGHKANEKSGRRKDAKKSRRPDEKKKFEAGASTSFINRTRAIRKLQLSLKDFRRLCILKGIYPHEPRHKKRVNKGSTAQRTWYFAKDINYLAAEPIIHKFREHKVYLRKVRRARTEKQLKDLKKLAPQEPKYALDHIVKERGSCTRYYYHKGHYLVILFISASADLCVQYPSLMDAVCDLDDALCLIFLFARLPASRRPTARTTALCHRLATEFMHYVIEARALRKVFLSIKGIYYQADIFGQPVTWIVQHERGYQAPGDVDFSVMCTFVEFYTVMLGFVNYKLYHDLGLHYPPVLKSRTSPEDDISETELQREMIDSFSYGIAGVPKSDENAGEMLDGQVDEELPLLEDETAAAQRARMRRQAERRLRSLFVGCKFYLGRETPAASLTFVIRACGGRAFWASGSGASGCNEDDPTITHHVIDRPSARTTHISRAYVQPQWVYDCVNAATLLPTASYLPGCVLPPHLSPFCAPAPGDYVPPEQLSLMHAMGLDVSDFVQTQQKQLDDANKNDKQTPKKSKKKKKTKKSPGQIDSVSVGGKSTETQNDEVKKMAVTEGAVHRPNIQLMKEGIVEEKKLKEMMIAKKYRRKYHRMVKGEKRKARDVRALTAKRLKLDRSQND